MQVSVGPECRREGCRRAALAASPATRPPRQPSPITRQPSAISHQPSPHHPSAVSCQLSAITRQLSAITHH
eukprot:3487221-Rhodomonas_salina.1